MKLRRSTTTMAVLPLFLVLACAAAAHAQQPVCQSRQAPEFNGFRIGMLLAEVKDTLADTSMFESKVTEGNKLGAQSVRISGAELKDEYAEGIDDINLTFVDGKLAVVRATYHSGAGGWLSAQGFFKQLSEKLGLPQPPASSSSGRAADKYKVECPRYNVTLVYSFGVSPNVTIADALAQKLVEERRADNPEGGTRRIGIGPGVQWPTPRPSPTPTPSPKPR